MISILSEDGSRRLGIGARRPGFGHAYAPPCRFAAVDRLDVRILREIMRDRVVVWGSNDPRLSAETLARRVRADPTTVRDRLRAWQRSGFLQGFTVLPNMGIFGAGLASGAICVPDLRAKAAVLD